MLNDGDMCGPVLVAVLHSCVACGMLAGCMVGEVLMQHAYQQLSITKPSESKWLVLMTHTDDVASFPAATL